MERSNQKPIKAVSLISGGLDSQLATKVVACQGVDVVGVHYDTGFIGKLEEGFWRKIERSLEIEIVRKSVDQDRYSEIIKYPQHNYGSAINPCIDCRIYVLRLAGEFMAEMGADFVVTGEVLGQRPMTQSKNSMQLIKRESGLENRLLRPLSAKLLDPTLPEKRGWVNQEDLYGIEGRSRKEQLDLAQQFEIEEYKQPAGGCLLTEEAFADRARELFEYRGRSRTNSHHFKLLKFGRHFRLPGGAKAIVGRDETDNNNLDSISDCYWKIITQSHPGPLTLVSPGANRDDILLAARITARYSQGRDAKQVNLEVRTNSREYEVNVAPLDRDDDRLEDYRI